MPGGVAIKAGQPSEAHGHFIAVEPGAENPCSVGRHEAFPRGEVSAGSFFTASTTRSR